MDRQASIEQMRAWAILDNRPQRMKAWVEDIFTPPESPIDYNNARQLAVADSDGKIAYAPLRVIAGQWDRNGLTAPMTFLNAIECEVPGTERYRIVQEALNNFDRVQMEAEAEADEDRWDWWNL